MRDWIPGTRDHDPSGRQTPHGLSPPGPCPGVSQGKGRREHVEQRSVPWWEQIAPGGGVMAAASCVQTCLTKMLELQPLTEKYCNVHSGH